jgi:hypothetical protein
MAKLKAVDEPESADQIPETANALGLPVFKFDPSKPDDIGNLCKKLSVEERLHVAEKLKEIVDLDEKSYEDWERDSAGYMKQVLKNEAPFDETTQEETAAEESHSRPSFGIIIGAVLQYNGRALDAILGTPDLVKSTAENDPASNSMATWASTELRVKDKNWVSDTDLLTIHYSVSGLGWRKRWVNRQSKKMSSTFLTCKEVIVNARAPRDIARVPRVTHCLEYYPHELAPMVASGDFCAFDYDKDDDDPAAAIHFREVHLWLDMDGDGVEEPWTATYVDEDHVALVALYPRWCGPGALEIKDDPENTYWTFKANLHFTPYHFIPSPDGKFHSLGYGWLLRKFEESTSHLLNDAIGITEKASADGGLAVGLTAGVTETITLKRDTLNVIPSDSGRSIQDQIQLFPSKQMPDALPKIIEMLITAADRLTGSTSTMNEAPADMTATLAAGLLQSNAATHSAIHRRLLDGCTNEVRAMADLAIAHGIGPQDAAAADTESLGLTADPLLATETQRAGMSMYLGTFLKDPLTNPVELRKRMHQLQRVPNWQTLIIQPQPPQATPGEKLKFASDMAKHITGRQEGDAKAAQAYATALNQIAQAGATLQQMLQAIGLIQTAVEGEGDGSGPGNDAGVGQPPGDGSPPPAGGAPPGPQAGPVGSGLGPGPSPTGSGSGLPAPAGGPAPQP